MRRLFLIAFAVLMSFTAVPTVQAQYMRYSVSPYPYRYWRADPAVNNYLSARYDRLLQISPRFRAYRRWKECHTITWPGLRQSCLASFDQYEPMLRTW